jgi:hypothetical protein
MKKASSHQLRSSLHVSQLENKSSEDEDSTRPKRETKVKFKDSEDDQVEKKKARRRKKTKRFHCTKCTTKMVFTTQRKLDNHLLNLHSVIPSSSIVCEICSSVLKSELFYKRHMRSKHPKDPKLYICDFDGRTFTTKDYIRVHMDRHQRHQILTCLTCQKSYVSRHTFRRHLKIVSKKVSQDSQI